MITHLIKGKSIFEKINKCTSSKIFCRNLCEMGWQPLRKFFRQKYLHSNFHNAFKKSRSLRNQNSHHASISLLKIILKKAR